MLGGNLLWKRACLWTCADVKSLARAVARGKTRNFCVQQIQISSGSLQEYGHLECGPEFAQNVNDPRILSGCFSSSQMPECHKGS